MHCNTEAHFLTPKIYP